MSEFLKEIATIVTAIIGVAIIAVLVSRNANTANVIGAGGGAVTQMLSAAEAPVTGGGGYNGGGYGYNSGGYNGGGFTGY